VNKKLLLIPLALLLALSLIAIGCPTEPTTTAPTTKPTTTTPTTTAPTKDKIVVGLASPVSGPWATIREAALLPIMQMWQEEVNADGGIYVEEYGKKLPIEYLIYDDTSDLGTMVRLTEKLIVEDHVDILFPACGSSMIQAQAPIANKYEMVLLTAEGGATTMKDTLPGMPYVFVCLNFSDWYQIPVLADTLKAAGAETVYMVNMADVFGVEYGGVSTIEFNRVGIDIVGNVTIPQFPDDFEPIIKEAKEANPDVFCAYAYPWIVLPLTEASMALDFNPKAWIGGPGANFGYYYVGYGDKVEGVCCFAMANRKTAPRYVEFYDDIEALVGPQNMDWWGHPCYEPLVSIWQQAIENTGTLDQKTIRDYIATNHFDTILGDTYFYIFGDGGGIIDYHCHPGEVGQYQSGVCEIVGYPGITDELPNYVVTSDFEYPKPKWPK
jgi:branched-chain amino acid transport system substrate-binding protein